jgi:hypothetical protein
MLYTLARWIVRGGRAVAIVHAGWIINFERAAHIAIEPPVRRLLQFAPASLILSNVYVLAQLVVLPIALACTCIDALVRSTASSAARSSPHGSFRSRCLRSSLSPLRVWRSPGCSTP